MSRILFIPIIFARFLRADFPNFAASAIVLAINMILFAYQTFGLCSAKCQPTMLPSNINKQRIQRVSRNSAFQEIDVIVQMESR